MSQAEFDNDNATTAARRILGWHPYLNAMPAAERERLVGDIVRELRDAWAGGDRAGFGRAIDVWEAATC